MTQLRRVTLIVTFALGILTAPLPADAQQPGKIARIGYLTLGAPPPAASPHRDALLQELRRLGYVEGQNIAFEARYADGKEKRLTDLAAELVRLPVDVIVTVATPAALAAKQATAAVPIVIVMVTDPAVGAPPG
jgi:putative ABC transport system substrate-binding protein